VGFEWSDDAALKGALRRPSAALDGRLLPARDPCPLTADHAYNPVAVRHFRACGQPVSRPRWDTRWAGPLVRWKPTTSDPAPGRGILAGCRTRCSRV